MGDVVSMWISRSLASSSAGFLIFLGHDLIDLIALRASTESVLLRNLRRSAVGIAGVYLAKM